MKILCLEDSLEECSSVLHPKHLLQCYEEVINTLLYLSGVKGPYSKSNANTKAWENKSEALFTYLMYLSNRIRKLDLTPSDIVFRNLAKVHGLYDFSSMGTKEGKSILPDWFGSEETLRTHRGWVIYKCSKSPNLFNHYMSLYPEYKPVTRIKAPRVST